MFEAIGAFFLLPIVVIGFLVLASIVFTACVENNDGYFVAIVVGVVGALAYHAQIMVAVANWQFFLLGILAYGIAGGIYSLYRWRKFCKEYIKDNPIEKKRHAWKNAKELEDHYLSYLQPSSYKSQLTGWIIFWPWSAVWNIVGDFITGIYDSLKAVYNKIAQMVVRSALKGVQFPTEKE